jgi:hypothetical protein
VSKPFTLNLVRRITIIFLLFGSFLTPDAFAKGLYKLVSADGKITYSNHPQANGQAAKNISLLKGGPKFSIANNQSYRAPGKS